LPLSHLARTEIHTISAELEEKDPQAAELARWKQIAPAKQTALALTNLASDNESRALKWTLNHLGHLELAGRKRKTEREKDKKERSKVKRRKKIPDPTSKLKKSAGQHSYAFGVCFDKHHSLYSL